MTTAAIYTKRGGTGGRNACTPPLYQPYTNSIGQIPTSKNPRIFGLKSRQSVGDFEIDDNSRI